MGIELGVALCLATISQIILMHIAKKTTKNVKQTYYMYRLCVFKQITSDWQCQTKMTSAETSSTFQTTVNKLGSVIRLFIQNIKLI
jgi:hypothetical protein